ncbi:MAG TPA: UDP-N-acetylmuramate dehydrogenase [Eoetvoesiella sp.]
MLHISTNDLTSYNTLGLHSSASALVRFASSAQLGDLSEEASCHDRVFVLGGGSNVVLGPSLDCLIVKVETRGIRIWDETANELIIEAQAGEVWHDFVELCMRNGWFGLENLALIPGTVGAAPVQNIGAYGVELDQRFHSLQAWDLHERRLIELNSVDCQFSYRDSIFKRAWPGRWLIVAVRFRLPKPWRPVTEYPDLKRHPQLEEAGADVTALNVFNAVCDIRRRKLPDPAVLGNAGSFFKNPIVSAQRYALIKAAHPEIIAYPQEQGSYKLAAGWLIDRAGWKGRRMGAVGMHDRQALVLVNYGDAAARDVVALADAIRADVAARFDVQLEQEPIAVW